MVFFFSSGFSPSETQLCPCTSQDELPTLFDKGIMHSDKELRSFATLTFFLLIFSLPLFVNHFACSKNFLSDYSLMRFVIAMLQKRIIFVFSYNCFKTIFVQKNSWSTISFKLDWQHHFCKTIKKIYQPKTLFNCLIW